ncbi:MAG: hypothetical protein OEY88_11810, partial [Candidatus Bathyarchaeota archaeon]|nr:hypothetical protein [Candidatus Bathyarchaeota archaeon]
MSYDTNEKGRKEKTTPKREHATVGFLILLIINILTSLPTPSTSSNTEETLLTNIFHPTNDSWIELAQPNSNHGTEREIQVKTSCD